MTKKPAVFKPLIVQKLFVFIVLNCKTVFEITFCFKTVQFGTKLNSFSSFRKNLKPIRHINTVLVVDDILNVIPIKLLEL